MRAVKIVVNLILGTVGVCALLILAGHFGYLNTFKPFIVQSGSMEPSIPVGSVVLVRPAVSYSENDVITFRQEENSKVIVTHRILQKKYAEDGKPNYITVGDANEDVDKWVVKDADIIGKSYFTLPYLGYAINQAKTPQGFILFVVIPATIIIYEELRSIQREIGKLFGKKGKKKDPWVVAAEAVVVAPASVSQQRGMPKVAIVLPIIGCFLVFISLSAAYFLDHEQSSKNIMGASSTFTSPLPTLTDNTNSIENLSEPETTATPTPSPTTVKPTPTATPEATESAILTE